MISPIKIDGVFLCLWANADGVCVYGIRRKWTQANQWVPDRYSWRISDGELGWPVHHNKRTASYPVSEQDTVFFAKRPILNNRCDNNLCVIFVGNG